ncbi:MAG TPA: PASTA domain-containing protein, partial [Candidatus Hydrogenedentes bacterium]|nr:PASTA domain-containing protein [Candidatus Hydrogenedentota bacterium]
SDTVPQGNVIAQSPAAGAIVLYGSVVTLTVSSGRCPVAVPDLRGQIRSTAEQMLRAAGLAVGTVSVACSNEVPIAAVIDQTPSAGTVVAPGTQVNFSVATGPCPVAVPQVIGLSLTDAEALITTSGLAVGAVTSVCSDSAAVGAVVSQSVPGGTQVMPGSAVNLVTASGPCAEPGVTVPNLIGRTQTNAQTSVTEAGLTLGSVIPQCSDTVAAGLVISQSPEPNSSVGSGTAVNLVVSSGPCAPPDDNGSGEENSAVNWGTQAPADRVIMSLLYDGFNGVDQDGDGKLTPEEALAVISGMSEASFRQIDLNGDQQLTRQELEAYLGIGGPLGCVRRLFVKNLLTVAGGDLLLSGLGLALLGMAALRRSPVSG